MSVPGPTGTPTTAWSSSACTRPSSPSSTTSTTCAGGRGDGRRVPGRDRQRLRGLGGLRQPLLARPLPRRRGGTDPAPPLRRRRLRRAGAGDPAVAASGGGGELVSRRPDGFEVPADWDEPAVARDLPRHAAGPELRHGGRARRYAARRSLNQWALDGRLDDHAGRCGARPRRGPDRRSASTPATSTS